MQKKDLFLWHSQAETDEQDGNILQGMRFLCAEDNELNAEILTELLKIEGAECTICENGEEILETFEQSVPGDYDMILMDVQMPVMNGYEATKAIRRSSHELAKTDSDYCHDCQCILRGYSAFSGSRYECPCFKTG